MTKHVTSAGKGRSYRRAPAASVSCKSSPSMERDIVEEMFAERVSNPLEWFKHSRSLLAAARSTRERAEVLIDTFEKSDLENVATMLYGFSLENLFKAIWTLKKFGSPHEEGWKPLAGFPSELKTHDLVKLAGMIDADLVKEYELSLSLLSDASTWSGRYPCSLRGDEGTMVRWPKINDDAEAIFKAYSKPFTSIS